MPKTLVPATATATAAPAAADDVFADTNRPKLRLRRFKERLERMQRDPASPPDTGGLIHTERFARDPKSVQDVEDHEEVILRLLRSGDVETLFDIVGSDLLHGLALRLYRTAIDVWLRR